MNTSGPNTYLFKKYLIIINRHSPDCAIELERIYEDFGAHVGYTAALALINFKEQADKTGQADDPVKYIGYLRQYPAAVARLRRAFEYLTEDLHLGRTEPKHLFRD